jgi:hypothetical protein
MKTPLLAALIVIALNGRIYAREASGSTTEPRDAPKAAGNRTAGAQPARQMPLNIRSVLDVPTGPRIRNTSLQQDSSPVLAGSRMRQAVTIFSVSVPVALTLLLSWLWLFALSDRDPACPKCGWHNVRASRKRGLGDRLMGLAFLKPYRCKGCRIRFYLRSSRRIRHTEAQT